jgi:tRNA dimethylallyltransferase
MILVLTGPTGVGKSEVALTLAKALNGEIVNGDAFQVYEGLHIATAVPTKATQQTVPHHLYSFVSLNESYNIARYQNDARAVMQDIISRGKTPIFVGGSGLYLRAALYDYDLSLDTSKVDMSPYEGKTNEELHTILEKMDPAEAKKIPVQNRRRLLRDIALCLAAGESKSSLLAKQKHEPLYPTKFFVLTEDRATLYPKLDRRVETMFQEGLLEETVPLIERYGRHVPAFQAIGVKELFPYLDHEISLEDAIKQIQIDTRHYVKRQETFFRHQFMATPVKNAEEILSSFFPKTKNV